MGPISKLTSDLRAETRKVSGLAGTYADFVYQGEALFLQEVAKRVRKIAGGHAQRVQVARQGGRAPMLVYEGEDRSDMNLEFTLHLISTSPQDVILSWFGESTMHGRFSEKQNFKWGQLTPDAAASIFQGVFGR